jgi:hypothetical protein
MTLWEETAMDVAARFKFEQGSQAALEADILDRRTEKTAAASVDDTTAPGAGRREERSFRAKSEGRPGRRKQDSDGRRLTAGKKDGLTSTLCVETSREKDEYERNDTNGLRRGASSK